jgi:hypothetical protein
MHIKIEPGLEDAARVEADSSSTRASGSRDWVFNIKHMKKEPLEEPEYAEFDPVTIPEKFRKEVKKERRSSTGVDWLKRISNSEAISLLDEEPPLWISMDEKVDEKTEESIRLMDMVRQGTIRKKDFPLLTEEYGLYVAHVVRKESISYISDLEEVTPGSQHREIQRHPERNACPPCGVAHLPDPSGRPCPARAANNPKVLRLLTDSWKDKVRGVFVGLYAMRSQPAELREVLLNASLNSNEEKDYTDDVGPYSSDNTVARQNLYKGLKRRLEIIKDKPTLPMFVEYHAKRRPNMRPGAVPVHWGPIRIIQKLQREAHNPIILVLPTLEVDYNTMDAPLRRSKQAYLESARELATMCEALGVPFVPLAVHDLELDTVLMRGKGHRPAFLWDRRGEPLYELQRRVVLRLTQVLDALVPVILGRNKWQAVIEQAV